MRAACLFPAGAWGLLLNGILAAACQLSLLATAYASETTAKTRKSFFSRQVASCKAQEACYLLPRPGLTDRNRTRWNHWKSCCCRGNVHRRCRCRRQGLDSASSQRPCSWALHRTLIVSETPLRLSSRRHPCSRACRNLDSD